MDTQTLPGEVPFTQGDRDLLMRLATAVFGLEGDGDSGLLSEMREINKKLGQLYMAIIAAALAFGSGSIAVTVAIVAVS